MSSRAAWRLETLGFTTVYRYVAGKIDWMAAGLATERELARHGAPHAEKRLTSGSGFGRQRSAGRAAAARGRGACAARVAHRRPSSCEQVTHTRRDCERDGYGGDTTMGERMDEAKGNIKEGIGKLTGDTETQAEGRTEHDTAKGKREVKGAANEVKGKVEEGLGKV